MFFPMFGETDGTRDKNLRKEVVERIVKFDLMTQCRLMGPRFPIEQWMMGLDALVVPAVRETFGRTLVEAMLCGTPVVAADDGGHREIIRHGETGFLVQPDNPEAFGGCGGGIARKPPACECHRHRRQAGGIAKTFLSRLMWSGFRPSMMPCCANGAVVPGGRPPY